MTADDDEYAEALVRTCGSQRSDARERLASPPRGAMPFCHELLARAGLEERSRSP